MSGNVVQSGPEAGTPIRAIASVLFGCAGVAYIVAEVGGFASCNEARSFLAGFGLLLSFPAMLSGTIFTVLGVQAYADRESEAIWRHGGLLGAIANGLCIVSLLLIWGAPDAATALLKLVQIDLTCGHGR
jgi:hypothetical protein